MPKRKLKPSGHIRICIPPPIPDYDRYSRLFDQLLRLLRAGGGSRGGDKDGSYSLGIDTAKSVKVEEAATRVAQSLRRRKVPRSTILEYVKDYGNLPLTWSRQQSTPPEWVDLLPVHEPALTAFVFIHGSRCVQDFDALTEAMRVALVDAGTVVFALQTTSRGFRGFDLSLELPDAFRSAERVNAILAILRDHKVPRSTEVTLGLATPPTRVPIYPEAKRKKRTTNSTA